MKKTLFGIIFLSLSLAVFTSNIRAAIYTVDRTDDGNVASCTPAPNDCSLRGAIILANASPDDDVINFDSALFSVLQTLVLSLGELRIQNNGSLTINGIDPALTIIDAKQTGRVFYIAQSATVALNFLTITGGDVHFNFEGGGIYNNGNLSISNSIIRNNLGGTQGGGISNRQLLNVSNTKFLNNTLLGAEGYSGGGAIDNSGTAFIYNSEFGNNTAGSYGGAISNSGKLLIYLSVISNNGVGGIRPGGGSAGGGGIYNRGNMSLDGVTISNNSSRNGDGGGIYNQGNADIKKSVIYGNTARGKGGGFQDSAELSPETISIINTTISGNSADLAGGLNFGYAVNNTVNLTNVTVAYNTNGGLIITAFSSGVSVINVRNSIFSNNSVSDFSGTLTSLGNNLILNKTSAIITGDVTGNIYGLDPLLGILQNNGGRTKTHALLPGSPAIDHGSTNFYPSEDQREFSRPADGDGNGSRIVDIGAFEYQSPGVTRPRFDFDGDGKADISVFRPDGGFWFLLNSASGFSAAQFGIADDKIVPADFDGDGKTDLAVYRSGTWYVQRSFAGFFSFSFGAPDDIPQPADFDGDGKADLTVFRPSNGIWYVYNPATKQFTATQFGAAADKPVASDYDGDGVADYAVFRPSNGTWYLNRSSLGFTGVQFGSATDKPVPADYDGDGRTDVAFYRPSNGTWYLNKSQLGLAEVQFGISTDLPTPADYDGDGKTDIAVFRSGIWYFQRSQAGFASLTFGSPADKPIPNAFVP